MADLQEEIFESEDFKETEVSKEIEEKEEKKEIGKSTIDLDVIEEAIQPSKAFQIYAGQLYDPQNNNYRENSKNNKNITQASRIFNSTQTHSNNNFESPLQTYKRLQFEIEEFQKKLDDISEKAKKDKEDPTKQITKQLSNQLSKLWSNVETFKNDPQISSLFSEGNSALLDTVDSNYLFRRLEEFQIAQSEISQSDDNKNNDENKQNPKAIFTLYHNGLMNTESFRMSEINSRLSNLESIIGPKPNNSTFNDMTKSIEYLSKVLELLSDENKLETLVRRAQILRKKLQEIQAKGHAAIELQITKTKEEKINKLFDMMTRWDQSALQLPTIVNRLRSIKNLHEESANIIQKVNKLNTQNKLINQSLISNQNILKNCQNSLAQNASIMQKNIKLIQQRLDKIQNTMGI